MVIPTRVVNAIRVDSFNIIECQACCSCLKGVNIHVYESMGRYSSDFKRISCFDNPNAVVNLANSVLSVTRDIGTLTAVTTAHFLRTRQSMSWAQKWKARETHSATPHSLSQWTFTISKFVEFLRQKACSWHWKALRYSIKVACTMMRCSHKFWCLRQLMI